MDYTQGLYGAKLVRLMFHSTHDRSFHFGDKDTVLKKSGMLGGKYHKLQNSRLMTMTTILHTR